MKILLLGSTGMVGSAIDIVCKERNLNYLGLSHNDIDIRDDDLEDKILDYYPDIIINAIGLASAKECDINPSKAFQINSISVNKLSTICRENDIKLAQISTHNIFNGKKDGYYSENDFPSPINIYGFSKYVAECFVRNICKKYYIFRFPVIFGNRRNNNISIMNKVFLWVKMGIEFRISDDIIDTPSYNLDLSNVVIDLLEDTAEYGIYHINNSGETSYYDFAIKVVEKTDSKSKVIRAKHSDFGGPIRQKRIIMKSAKLEPIRSWEEALDAYIWERKK